MKSSAKYLSNAQPATIAIIAFAYFVIAVTALYFLNPSYSLIKSFVGNYDLGAYQFIVASTFFSLGLGSLALVIGLYQAMPQSAHSWIGLLPLVMCGVGMFAAGIFPANDGGSTVSHKTTVLLAGVIPVEAVATPETVFSFIHIIAIIVSLFSLSVAAIVSSWRFRHKEKWGSIYHFSLILGLVMITASILLFLVIFSFIPTEFEFSLSLKLLTFSSVVWLFLIATHLRFGVVKAVLKRQDGAG